MHQSLFEHIDLNDFCYDLPNEKIAFFPNKNRDGSKLLIFSKSNIEHTTFKNISKWLPENSLLAINSTKVIPARIMLEKKTSGIVELLCIEPLEPSNDPQIAMTSTDNCQWECIVGGRNIKEGTTLVLSRNVSEHLKITLNAKILQRYDNKAIVHFNWEPKTFSFASIIDKIGKIPLPPYIKRNGTEEDKNRYQTVYANTNGSVAAPTAGLHFSNEILTELTNKNIQIANLILHVGPGTFIPINTSVREHNMHYEQFFIHLNELNKLKEYYENQNKFIIATGTTSLRTLESLYWIGAKLLNKINHNDINLKQHEPYEINTNISMYQAVNAIIDYLKQNKLYTFNAKTQLFIVPGYQIKSTDALITNFHLPKSTLLLLVAAFIGKNNLNKIYDAALQNDYKFLSYGDTSLIIRNQNY